jgi:hypothetical protein
MARAYAGVQVRTRLEGRTVRMRRLVMEALLTLTFGASFGCTTEVVVPPAAPCPVVPPVVIPCPDCPKVPDPKPDPTRATFKWGTDGWKDPCTPLKLMARPEGASAPPFRYEIFDELPQGVTQKEDILTWDAKKALSATKILVCAEASDGACYKGNVTTITLEARAIPPACAKSNP